MKYMLLFCGTQEEDDRWAAMPEAEKSAAYERVGGWFTTNGEKIVEANELQHGTTATTIRWDSEHKPIVTDGPFAEGGEVIGGYAVVNAADLDEALALAKSWPGGPVELRPVVER